MESGAWSINPAEGNNTCLKHQNGYVFNIHGARMTDADGAWLCDVAPDAFEFSGLNQKYVWEGDLCIHLSLEDGPAPDWLQFQYHIENLRDTTVRIERMAPVCIEIESTPQLLDRILVNGLDMCSFTHMSKTLHAQTSHMVVGLTAATECSAVVLGAIRSDDAFYSIEVDNESTLVLKPVCNIKAVTLNPGETFSSVPWLLGLGKSLSTLMDTYALAVANQMGYRNAPSLTGWCSWYYYYNTATEDDIWDNVKALKESPLAEQIQVIQIDDGWNLPHRKHARNWGDWEPGGMFAKGMKSLADNLKLAGFLPGLWLAPFSVDKDSQFFLNHPDWLVQSDEGPIMVNGAYGLDLSHPAALNFLYETFDRVFNQWGFEYVKIDFLIHGMMPGQRYDNTIDTAALIRKGLQVIRDVAGDRYILGCGSPLAPAIGVVDAMRIGYDVSSRWNVLINEAHWPAGNLNIRSAAIHTIWRHWMHGRW